MEIAKTIRNLLANRSQAKTLEVFFCGEDENLSKLSQSLFKGEEYTINDRMLTVRLAMKRDDIDLQEVDELFEEAAKQFDVEYDGTGSAVNDVDEEKAINYKPEDFNKFAKPGDVFRLHLPSGQCAYLLYYGGRFSTGGNMFNVFSAPVHSELTVSDLEECPFIYDSPVLMMLQKKTCEHIGHWAKDVAGTYFFSSPASMDLELRIDDERLEFNSLESQRMAYLTLVNRGVTINEKYWMVVTVTVSQKGRVTSADAELPHKEVPETAMPWLILYERDVVHSITHGFNDRINLKRRLFA
ncbi:MAG: hypothetical protein AAF542_07355 [Pseudomonadota bacterium]